MGGRMGIRVAVYCSGVTVTERHAGQVSDILKGAGYEPIVRWIGGTPPTDGSDIVEKAHFHLINASVTPGSIGWDIIENVFLDPATADDPVIVCSADLLDPQLSHLFETNGCTLLSKPFRPEQLARTVKGVEDKMMRKLYTGRLNSYSQPMDDNWRDSVQWPTK